jgi:hypothetical protein
MSEDHEHTLCWKDCDKAGHEVDCYVANCNCGWESYDCEEVDQ